MSAPSPVQSAGAMVSVDIQAGGKPIDSSYQVISIDVWSGVNRIPKARLVISDGTPETAAFPISDGSAFSPGAQITIALGYDGAPAQVFSGVVYQQGVQAGRDTPSCLIVDAADRAMVMTLARNNAIFEKMSDVDVMKKLVGAAGLKPQIDGSTPVQPAVVQFYSTDWDLLLIRAQVNGMVVVAADGAVKVAPPDTGKAPRLTLTYGQSIIDFRADMDASTQYAASAIQSVAWDPATQALLASGTASTGVTAPGNLSPDTLAAVFGVKQYRQQSAGPLDKAGLTAWSSAELLKTRLAKIRGEVRYQGSTLAAVGDMVTLAGLGARFNGNAYVSAMHHRMEDGWWTSTATIGLSPDWFADTAPRVNAPGAGGLLPAASNLQTGVVLRTDGDPEGEFRVQVSLPLLQAGALGVWARLGGPYASDKFGAVFYPEAGDEVVVAFMDGDPRAPVIVGSLYSKKRPPPVTPDPKNASKTIMTRARLRIDFFDEEQALEISTDKKHSIRLDDKNGVLTIRDAKGNSIRMEAGGITLDSVGKVTINAKTDIALAAQGTLSLSGKAGVTLTGLSISAKADTTFEAQGSASAKLASSGMLTVQGALVKIN